MTNVVPTAGMTSRGFKVRNGTAALLRPTEGMAA